MQGFKTFPDKTKLDFTNGITAVVGPNGSGKSNISDAIRWVLGEQSAKVLRCSKMEDVIFNGTQQRKKTGYAQVTLSIDNSDRTLQFDGDEVAVTRRFYRSGNSEYLINNTAVRLQDIHELFMDTGLGRDGYSMIGQGKIDSIVSSKSEDRREIFEEAAGISRFRYKKADAEKRLDKTEENLIRLRDIMSELEGRVEPLRVQSEKAKAYLTYAEEKRGLEIALWLRTLEKSAQQVREQEDKIAVAQSQYNDIEKILENIQSQSEDIFNQQNNFNRQADELRGQISEYDNIYAQKSSEISVLRNDILHNEQNAERIKNDILSAKESEKLIADEIAEKEKIISENQKILSLKNAESSIYTKTLNGLKNDESKTSAQLDTLNAEIAELSENSANAKITYMTSSSSINEITARMESVENTVKARSSQKITLKNIISDYQKMLDECIENISELSQKISVSENSLHSQKADCDRLKSDADSLSLDSEQLFRKAKMLEELERNLEGFLQSVKIILRESQKGNISGIHGAVSRVIKTPSEYSTAIEIALGAAMQNIVVSDENAAKAAIAYLKRINGGRATFLPINIIQPRHLDESGLENCRGFIGIASNLCSCDDTYKNILENLLGRIVIAKDIDCATDIARKYSYRFKIVTLDGQVVNAGGSLTGGSLAKNTGLLGRASEIEKIRQNAKTISDRAENTRHRYDSKLKTFSEMSAQLNQLKNDLAKLNEDKIKISAEIHSRKTELANTEKSLSEILSERTNSVARLEELTQTMNTARAEYEKYSKNIQEKQDNADILANAKNDFSVKKDKVNEKLQEIKLAVLTLEKDISSANADIQNAKLRAENAKEKIKNYQNEIQSTLAKNETIKQQIQSLETDMNELAEKSALLKQDIEDISQSKTKLDNILAELRKTERDKLSERENISGELARLQERRANLQKQYDEITAKLWEEYELTKREAENIAVKIEEVGKAQRRLNELKQKIRSLGNVNVSAIEEYKEVKERYEFLKVQINDIEKSKAELLKLINDLTKQMREIFVERFNLINLNFSQTFVELFGGGKASLSLSDTENVLTSGIDISVEPPGKIVSHIELLSGGEKALVAIALYFAIMKVSPAPFCVMDEIEAALDDVNVYRFAAYLRRMNDNTQFICITHRRGTMEEADVLYGVTMQDRGISKLLELRASEVEQKLGIK